MPTDRNAIPARDEAFLHDVDDVLRLDEATTVPIKARFRVRKVRGKERWRANCLTFSGANVTPVVRNIMHTDPGRVRNACDIAVRDILEKVEALIGLDPRKGD